MPDTEQSFYPPPTYIGEEVYWYPDPLNLTNPALAWVHSGVGDPSRDPDCRPRTVTLLVSQADGSFALRRSVRHKDDPGLIDNQKWREWGCWELSRRSHDLARIVALLPSLTVLLARSTPCESGKKSKE